jgi:hypothetical protein
MNTKRTLAASIAAIGLALAAGSTIAHQPAPARGAAPAAASGAQHDHGAHGAAADHAMRGGTQVPPMAAMQSDPAARADLDLVHTMVHGHASISRTVTDLPDGIRTLTESSDPAVAAALMAHVGSMVQRLESGKEFNLFSSTIPVLFANRDRIVTRFEVTPRGAMVVQTSTDPMVAAALQAHAREVSELATEGPVAMQRNMQRARMAGGSMMTMRTGSGMGAGMGHGMRQGMGMGMGHGQAAGSHAGQQGRNHGH